MIDTPKDENEFNENDFDDQDLSNSDDLNDFESNTMDDDFDDHDDFGFNDDLMDQDFDEGQSYTADNPSSRSVNWFNIILFGGMAVGVIVLCVIFIPTFFGGNQPESSIQMTQQQDLTAQNQQSAQTNREIAEEAVGNGLSEQISQSGGLLANPDLLNDESNEQAVAEATINRDDEMFVNLNEQENAESNNAFEQAASNATQSSSTISEDEMSDIFSNVDESTEAQDADINGFAALPTSSRPLPQPSDNVPYEPMPVETVDNDITREPLEAQQPPSVTLANPSENATADMPAVQPAVQNADATNTDNTQLTAQVDQLSSQLEQQTQNNEELQNTIARLEQRLNALTQQQAAATATAQEEPEPAPQPEPASEPVQEEQTESVASKQPVKPVAKTPSPAPAPAPVVQQDPANWELRGASPGEAYLADTNSGNMRTVAVGDNLRGIGKITSIAIENNQWVVRGTSGVVRQ